MGLWSAFMDAIPAYTGLSPMSFFTVVAVLYGIYHVAVSVFGGGGNVRDMRSREAVQMEPVPEPVQLGEVTEEVLKAYDGSDPTKPLLMAIKGQIYDVTQSKMFYGPGGPYALFAGKDASRALSKMSFEEQDLNGNLEGLGPFELDALQDWEYKFMSKYVKVGTIKKSVTKEVEVTGSVTKEVEVTGSVTKEVEVTGSESKDDNEKTEEPKENGDHSEPRDVSLNSEGRPEGESVSQIATESERHEANHPAEVDH